MIEAKDGKVTRFDLAAKGTRKYAAGARGGYYQDLSANEFPLAYALTLTDAKHFTYRIPPHTILAHSEAVYFRD